MTLSVTVREHVEDLPPPPGPTETGKRHSLELPGDFLQGESVIIDDLHVNNLKPAP